MSIKFKFKIDRRFKKTKVILRDLLETLSEFMSKLREKAERYLWKKHARPEQIEPEGDWNTWLILAGRGFGKTRTGAETIRKWVESGKYKRIALIGNTTDDVRQVMVEGESGLLSVFPEEEKPQYEPSKQQITFQNGVVIQFYSAENPEKLRGPQFDAAWVDEFAKFRNAEEVWNQLQFALRLGKKPRTIITTTPRPKASLKSIMKDPKTVVTKGSTFDNATNLAESFLHSMRQKFEGTRLGAQELKGEIVESDGKALWQHDQIDKLRTAEIPKLQRIVIGVDPATTSKAHSDETGIVVAGIGYDQRAYVLEDLSGKLSPTEWAKRVVSAYERYQADRVVAEINAGGELVEKIVRSINPYISFKAVRATRGKWTRAEPIAALYEQGKISHARGLETLESQMCTYLPGASKSPDRLDALVWGLSELMLEYGAAPPPQGLGYLGGNIHGYRGQVAVCRKGDWCRGT